MEPKSIYVHSVISGTSLRMEWRVFLNKPYASYWGWGSATQKSSGSFMCEWKNQGRRKRHPLTPHFMLTRVHALLTCLDHPAVQLKLQFQWCDHVAPGHQEEHGRRFAAAAAWTSSQSLKNLLQRWCCMSAAHFSFCGGRAGYFRGDKRERASATGGATQWHPDHSVCVSPHLSLDQI